MYQLLPIKCRIYHRRHHVSSCHSMKRRRLSRFVCASGLSSPLPTVVTKNHLEHGQQVQQTTTPSSNSIPQLNNPKRSHGTPSPPPPTPRTNSIKSTEKNPQHNKSTTMSSPTLSTQSALKGGMGQSLPMGRLVPGRLIRCMGFWLLRGGICFGIVRIMNGGVVRIL